MSGVVWRAEILQEADAPFPVVGRLSFPADEPLVIEWDDTGKEEVICASTATLRIISPGDRTYEDLYSIDVGRVRLDVYRDNVLYWSGCMDTEFYEEPYETKDGYEVSVTFSDFGVLDRLKYNLSGMQTLRTITDYCAVQCGINHGGIDESLISSSLTPGGAALSLADIKVRSDNFYDEDGEASTLEEVIEGIFQPLALRMVQRAGKIWVYDLNGLYTKAERGRITWNGDSQTLGTDRVYNNAKITWSTYAQSGNLLPSTCWGDIETDRNTHAINILSGGEKDGARYFSYHYSTNPADWIDATDCGFTIWTAKEGKNAETGGNTRFFKIVPQYDGTECEGVAIYWRTIGYVRRGSGMTCAWEIYGEDDGAGNPKPGASDNIGGVLVKSNTVWIPPVDMPGKVILRVGIEMLVDPRFNPFEEAEKLMKGAEQNDWYDQFKKYGNFVYVPVTVKFQPDGSDTVYVWDNRAIVKRSVNSPVLTLNDTFGDWVEYSGDGTPNAWGYLCWYDAKDRRDTSGALEWKKNRPAINPHDLPTISALTNAENSQYIPYPRRMGGRLWVEVRAGGWKIVNEGTDLDNAENGPKDLWKKISWILMKLPEVEIVNASRFDQTIDTEDVEYNAQLNRAAKEPIEIDTVCGTSDGGVPTARGAYFNAKTGDQIEWLSRGGRTTQVEDLLIGTLYSQFARRHTTLSGEARLAHGPVAVYTEESQGGKLFMLSGDVQDTRMDSSDAVYVELSPDEYKRNNE